MDNTINTQKKPNLIAPTANTTTQTIPQTGGASNLGSAVSSGLSSIGNYFKTSGSGFAQDTRAKLDNLKSIYNVASNVGQDVQNIEKNVGIGAANAGIGALNATKNYFTGTPTGINQIPYAPVTNPLQGKPSTPAVVPPTQNPQDKSGINQALANVDAAQEQGPHQVKTTQQQNTQQQGATVTNKNGQQVAVTAKSGISTNADGTGSITSKDGSQTTFSNPQEKTQAITEAVKTGDLDPNDPRVILDNIDQAHSDMVNQVNSINSGHFALDPESQAAVNAVQQNLQQTMQNISASVGSSQGAYAEMAARTGMQMSSPSQMIGGLNAIVSGGIGQINSLNQQANNQIAQITAASKAGQIKALQDGFQSYQDTATKRMETIQKMNNDIFDHQMKIQDQKLKIQQFQQKVADDKVKNSIAYSRLALARQSAARAAANATAGDATGGMTPEAVKMLATNYAITGNLPSLGVGKNAGAIKTQIFNQAATLSSGGAIANAKQTYAANTDSIKKLTVSANKLNTINNTIKNTLPQLADLADKVNLPLIPSGLERAAIETKAAFGNRDASNYINALNTIQAQLSGADAAEVGATAGGQLYIQRAQEAIGGGLTGSQYRDLINTFDNIASQSHQSMQNQIQETQIHQGALMHSDNGEPNYNPLGLDGSDYESLGESSGGDPLGLDI